jgi:hypothetical protein
MDSQGPLPDDNPWAVLGLSPGSSREAVRRAYRDLVRHRHPDRYRLTDPARYRRAEEELKRINAAYRALLSAATPPPAAPSPPTGRGGRTTWVILLAALWLMAAGHPGPAGWATAIGLAALAWRRLGCRRPFAAWAALAFPCLLLPFRALELHRRLGGRARRPQAGGNGI